MPPAYFFFFRCDATTTNPLKILSAPINRRLLHYFSILLLFSALLRAVFTLFIAHLLIYWNNFASVVICTSRSSLTCFKMPVIQALLPSGATHQRHQMFAWVEECSLLANVSSRRKRVLNFNIEPSMLFGCVRTSYEEPLGYIRNVVFIDELC